MTTHHTGTPEALAAEAVAALWQAIGGYSVQCSKTGELAPSQELVDAVDRLAALAIPSARSAEPQSRVDWLNPYRHSKGSGTIWASGFRAAERVHSITIPTEGKPHG